MQYVCTCSEDLTVRQNVSLFKFPLKNMYFILYVCTVHSRSMISVTSKPDIETSLPFMMGMSANANYEYHTPTQNNNKETNKTNINKTQELAKRSLAIVYFSACNPVKTK